MNTTRSLLISSFICLLFLSLSLSIRSVYAAEVSKVHVFRTFIKDTDKVIRVRTVEIMCGPEEDPKGRFKVVEIFLKLDSINLSNFPAGFFNKLKDRVDLDLFYRKIKFAISGDEFNILPFCEILGGMQNSILKRNFIGYLESFQNLTKTSFLFKNNMQSLDIDFDCESDFDSDSYKLMRSKLIHYCRFELHKFLLELPRDELVWTYAQTDRIAFYQVIMDLLKRDEISEPVDEGCDEVDSRRQYIHSFVAKIKNAEKEEEEDIIEPPEATEQHFSRHRLNPDAESDSGGGGRVESVLLADTADAAAADSVDAADTDDAAAASVDAAADTDAADAAAASVDAASVDAAADTDAADAAVAESVDAADYVDAADAAAASASVDAASDTAAADSVDAAADTDSVDAASDTAAAADSDNLINLALDRDLERDHGTDGGADNTSTATIPEGTNVAPILVTDSEPGTFSKAESLVATEEDLSSKTRKRNKNTKKKNNKNKKNYKENKENNEKNKNKKKSNEKKSNNADKKTQAINVLRPLLVEKESELRLSAESSSEESSAAESSSSELSAAADLSDEGDDDISGEAPDAKLLDVKQPDIDLSAANEKDAESPQAATESAAATVIPEPKVAQKSSSVLFLFLIGLITAVLIGALAWAIHRHFKTSEEEASE